MTLIKNKKNQKLYYTVGLVVDKNDGDTDGMPRVLYCEKKPWYKLPLLYIISYYINTNQFFFRSPDNLRKKFTFKDGLSMDLTEILENDNRG